MFLLHCTQQQNNAQDFQCTWDIYKDRVHSDSEQVNKYQHFKTWLQNTGISDIHGGLVNLNCCSPTETLERTGNQLKETVGTLKDKQQSTATKLLTKKTEYTPNSKKSEGCLYSACPMRSGYDETESSDPKSLPPTSSRPYWDVSVDPRTA